MDKKSKPFLIWFIYDKDWENKQPILLLKLKTTIKKEIKILKQDFTTSLKETQASLPAHQREMLQNQYKSFRATWVL